VKGEYADCVIGMSTADYMPDPKAKILKREAHIALDLKRKLSSAASPARSVTAPYLRTRPEA
jgi:hypothetical protein